MMRKIVFGVLVPVTLLSAASVASVVVFPDNFIGGFLVGAVAAVPSAVSIIVGWDL